MVTGNLKPILDCGGPQPGSGLLQTGATEPGGDALPPCGHLSHCSRASSELRSQEKAASGPWAKTGFQFSCSTKCCPVLHWAVPEVVFLQVSQPGHLIADQATGIQALRIPAGLQRTHIKINLPKGTLDSASFVMTSSL